MNELTAEAENEIRNFVDASVNSVSTNTMAVADDMVETISSNEMKEELNLLTRWEATVSTRFMFEVITESLLQVVNDYDEIK